MGLFPCPWRKALGQSALWQPSPSPSLLCVWSYRRKVVTTMNWVAKTRTIRGILQAKYGTITVCVCRRLVVTARQCQIIPRPAAQMRFYKRSVDLHKGPANSTSHHCGNMDCSGRPKCHQIELSTVTISHHSFTLTDSNCSESWRRTACYSP